MTDTENEYRLFSVALFAHSCAPEYHSLETLASRKKHNSRCKEKICNWFPKDRTNFTSLGTRVIQYVRFYTV
jgi:hypothetical protein